MPGTRLSQETQTLHAELLERLGVREAQRTIGNLEGTFSRKTIGGKEYLYFQHYTPGGGRRNISLGAWSPSLEEMIELHRQGRREQAEDIIGIRELCAQLKAGNIFVAPNAAARVIRELAECSVFRVGGVLVGTQAFGCIGNLLGMRWDTTTLGTQDVDIAVEQTVSVAVPDLTADIPKALASLSMGFFPIPQLNPRHPSTSFSVRKSPLRVDLLTPKRGPNADPVYIPRLKAAAQPLSFLDYLIEDPVAGAVINGDAVPVLLPQPVRFGLHKLITSQLRGSTMAAKARKDLYQAHQLLLFFRDQHPYELRTAWRSLARRGGTWKKRLEEGAQAAAEMFGSFRP